MILAGVDLAWGDKKPSAIAIGELQGNRVSAQQLDATLGGPDAVADRLGKTDALVGIAIDAPLIINNISGQRPCETALGRAYGARGCSCHTSNATRFPSATSVRLSSMLEARGFDHLRGDKWQIECYPHPAIVNLFQLTRVLKYKKGKVRDRREGQKFLAAQIRALSHCEQLELHVKPECGPILDSQFIDPLRGRDLKMNEDYLDSLICLYIAGLYAIGHSGELFGDTVSGYIWVPRTLGS